MNGMLFLTPVTTSRMGGMEIYNDQLASALGTKLKGNVSLLAVEDPHPIKAQAQAPYRLLSMRRFYRLPSRTLRAHLMYRWASWLAGRSIREHGLDFILCGYAHMLPLAIEISRQHHIPFGVVGHGIELWGPLATHKHQALQQVERAIAVSRFTASKMAEKGISPLRIHVLSPHVDTERYHPDAAAGAALRRQNGWEGKTLLLTIARVSAAERYKGHDAVMQAVRQARLRHPNLLYLISGDGDDLPRLKQLAREWDLESHVQFLGFVPEAQKVALYNACDIFVMASQVQVREQRWTGEGFGIVFIEASACGKAVIGPNVGGAVDAVDHEVTGLRVNPENVQDLTGAILKLAQDPELRERYGAQGRQRAETQWALHKLPNHVEDFLHALSQRPAAV